MTTQSYETSINKEDEYKYFIDMSRFADYLKKNQAGAIKVEDIEQHYIARNENNTVRIRVSVSEGMAKRVLCIKTKSSVFNELEHEVSEEFANAILSDEVKTSSITKKRLTFPIYASGSTLKLELDVYGGRWEGVAVAEVEVPYEGFEIPSWALPDFIIRQMDEQESFDLSNYALATMDAVTANLVLSELQSLRK